ncbi:MAG TPA: hypothetical protein PKB14_03260 [Rubrivivax sp.]|nr:hypothetical protein [Rubrivivax sp.]
MSEALNCLVKARSRCPHPAADIPQLALQRTALTCPEHQRAFDIRSGEGAALGNRPLKRWPTQAADGRLLAHWRAMVPAMSRDFPTHPRRHP